ncbi:hypothetical protein [Streptomyces scopuliridis]
MLTIDVAILLAVIVVLRLRRRTEARSRLDEKFTVPPAGRGGRAATRESL